MDDKMMTYSGQFAFFKFICGSVITAQETGDPEDEDVLCKDISSNKC